MRHRLVARLARPLAATLLALAAPGCGAERPAAPLPMCNEFENVPHPLTFTGDPLKPRIDWAPACAAATLHIEDSRTGVVMWDVRTPDGNALLPGMRYGAVPRGAQEAFGPAQPLVHGGWYRVTVLMFPGGSTWRDPVVAYDSYNP